MWEPASPSLLNNEQKRKEEAVQGFFIMIVIVALIGFLVFTGFKGVSKSQTVAKERENTRQVELGKEIAAAEEYMKKEKTNATESNAAKLSEAYRGELETSYGSLEISLMELEQSRVKTPYKTTNAAGFGYTVKGERETAVVESLTPFDKIPSIKDIAPVLDKEMQPILEERKLTAKEEERKAAEEERKIQESYRKYLNENSK